MAGKKNIGATLSLKNGNFFTGIKSASSATDGFKSKLKGATSGLKTHSSQLTATGSGLKSLAGKIVGVVAAYASVNAIKNWGSACLEAANAATAANVRLNTIMAQIPGNTQAMTDSVAKYSSELSKVTTISATAQKSGASQLASFQMSADSIKKLMPQLNNLAVANYGANVSNDQMIQAANMLGKAYAGQTGAMTRAGIVMHDWQAELIKTGDEATKTATLVEVLQQNFGNLAQEMAKTPEGVWLRIQNQVGALKVMVGNKLQPVVVSLGNYVADNMPKIENAVSHILTAAQPVFDWITGTAMPKVGGAINGVVDTVKGIYTAVSPSLENLKGAFVNIGNALGTAFSGASVSGVTSLATGALSTVIDALSTTGNLLAGIINHWDTLSPIIYRVGAAVLTYKGYMTALNVVSGVKNTLIAVGAATTSLSAKALGEMTFATLAQTAASGALKTAQMALNAAFVTSPIGWIVLGIGALVGVFTLLWNKCEGFRNFWKGMWSGVKNVTSNVMGAIKTTISDKLTNIKSAYEEHGGGIKGVAFAAMQGVKEYFTLGYDFINNLTGGKLGEVVGSVKDKISSVKRLFSDGWDNIKTNTAEAWGNIRSAYEEHGGGLAGVAASAMEGVQQCFSFAYDGLNTITGGKLGEVVNLANEKLSAAKDAISSKWEEIKSSTAEKWQDITSGAKQFAENIRSGLVDKFTSIKNGIVDAWKGVVSGIKGCINRIISAVNTMIGGVNKISFDTPDWVPGIGGKKWGFNIPKIPMLANGGVIRQPGSVIVGERGPETLTLPKGASVTPLDKGKRSENINHFDIDININGVDKPLDEAFNEALEQFVARLQLQLANL